MRDGRRDLEGRRPDASVSYRTAPRKRPGSQATLAVSAVLLGLIVGLIIPGRATNAQQAGQVPRVGFLAMGRHPSFPVFTQGLRDLGYVDGRNVVLEPRFAEPGRPEQFDALASDLVQRRADVIVALIHPEIAAARRATSTIPIVMVIGVDPVGNGFARSLARPGGNVTGLAWDADPDFVGKSVQILAELLPGLKRIGGLVDPAFFPSGWEAADRASGRARLTLQRIEVRTSGDFERAFAVMKRDRVESVLVFGGSMLFGSRAQIAELGLNRRLPVMFPYREAVDAGALISYGPSLPDLWRRAAIYVDKILRGARPADLPIEHPTKFELVINLRTAKALELTIPSPLLLRADHVVE